ncbi:MAG: hypothetical protein C4289_02430, partial [Chloroflexota bacterium]
MAHADADTALVPASPAVDAVELCQAFLTATRALLVAATEGDDLLVAQALRERAGLLSGLESTGPLTQNACSRCLELLQQARQIEQDARARLA